MDAIVIGSDASEDRLDVAPRPTGGVFSVARDADGLDALVARLAPSAPTAVAVEATGGYETVVAATLGAAGLAVVVVNPAQVRAFARALGRRAKTDPIDAGVIAHFVAATKPDVRPLPDDATRLLADLVARRRQIVRMIVAERQRRTRPTGKRPQGSIARLLAALQRELSSLETDIDDAVRGSPARREKEDLLASVPGIGATIARTPLAELCRNSAPRIAARSPPWSGSPRGPASPASGRARASSAAAGPGPAPPSSWAPWSRPGTIPT
jgi:transposase